MIYDIRDALVFFGVVGVLLLLLSGCFTKIQDAVQASWNIIVQQIEEEKKKETEPVEIEATEAMVEIEPKREALPEENIYTFFQGPRAWNSRVSGSGEWAEMAMDGGAFGNFGCGFCCMANIYSTFSPYECSPVDVYNYSREITYYEGGGAIAWGYLKQTLEAIGFDCETGEKPDTYEEFCEIVKNSPSVIVLISSNDDDSYWQDTPGHYVTLFDYNEETEEIFLGDSGDLNHNRSRVPLETIYKALKTNSNKQYMTIGEYQEDKNEWKWNDITETWVGW